MQCICVDALGWSGVRSIVFIISFKGSMTQKKDERIQGTKIIDDLSALVFNSHLGMLSLGTDRTVEDIGRESVMVCLEMLGQPSEQNSSGAHYHPPPFLCKLADPLAHRYGVDKASIFPASA